MRPNHSRSLGLAALVASLAITTGALAGDVARAEALFEEGKRLLAEGRIEDACKSFGESVREDPGMGARFKLAECHEKIGRFASAWAGFSDVARIAKERKQSARERAARERANAIEKRVPKLLILVEGPDIAGIEVFRNEAAVPRTSWGVPSPVDPGTLVIRAKAPGYVTWEQTVNMPAEARASTVVIPDLVRAPKQAPPPAAIPAPQAKPRAPEIQVAEQPTPAAPKRAPLTGGRIAALGLGGAGVLALAGGAAIGLQALAKNSDSASHCEGNTCDSRGVALRDDALDAANKSTWLLAGGGVLVAGSIALWTLSPPKSERPEVGVTPLPGGGAFVARGRW